MLPIANKPMLMYGFDQLRASGINEIGVILGPLQEGITGALEDGSKFGVKVTYISQPEPKGIAHAVLISHKFLGDSPFIVHLGDNLLKDNIPELAREFLKSGADASVVLTQVKDPDREAAALIANALAKDVIDTRAKVARDSEIALLASLGNEVKSTNEAIAKVDAAIASFRPSNDPSVSAAILTNAA